MAEPKSHAVDLRLFVVAITVTMTLSFLAGIGILDPMRLIQNSSNNNNNNNINDATSESPLKVRDMFADVNSTVTAMAGTQTPVGEHLLVDIEGVEEAFLNSEERLTKAMVQTVEEAGLILLSYHCHSLIPSGISCVGVLLESHISFHTWPEDGVITLDLFTCTNVPLLSKIDVIKRLFGVGERSRAKWSHELRGFPAPGDSEYLYMDDESDLSLWVLSPLDLFSKELIYSGKTKFQRIDIWDIVEINDLPGYRDVIKYNLTEGDPRLNSPEYATPERLLFLDGTLQSMKSVENIYHEALVHPAMFAHPNPKRAVILGGGEGATAREILKHNTIEHVDMLELDEDMITVSRKYLASMSDCSDLVGRAENCFDDELLTVHNTDGMAWFMDRFSNDKSIDEEQYDVIVIDALDPEDGTENSGHLYNTTKFVDSLVNALTPDGVMVIQVGTTATIDDVRPDKGIYAVREALFNKLEQNPSVEVLMVYEEPNCGFLEPHSFLIACRSIDCRSRWYARSDQVEYEIYERIVLTESGERALTYFDGTTQRSYQWPKKGWETVYCRREPMPFECQYRSLSLDAEIHDFSIENEEDSSFRVEVEKGDNGKIESTRVFARNTIRKGSLIMPNHVASSLQVTTRNLEGLERNVQVGGGRVAVIEDLLAFFNKYSHKSTAVEGSQHNFIEIGGSCLMRRSDNEQEANIERWMQTIPMASDQSFHLYTNVTGSALTCSWSHQGTYRRAKNLSFRVIYGPDEERFFIHSLKTSNAYAYIHERNNVHVMGA